VTLTATPANTNLDVLTGAGPAGPGWFRRWLLRRHTHLHRRIEFQPIRAEDVYDPVEPAHADHDCWTQCAGTWQFHRRDQEGVTITEKVHESAHRPIRTFTPPTKTDEDDSF